MKKQTYLITYAITKSIEISATTPREALDQFNSEAQANGTGIKSVISVIRIEGNTNAGNQSLGEIFANYVINTFKTT